MKMIDTIIWILICVSVFCFGVSHGITIAQREAVNIGSGVMVNNKFMHVVGTNLVPEQPMFGK